MPDERDNQLLPTSKGYFVPTYPQAVEKPRLPGSFLGSDRKRDNSMDWKRREPSQQDFGFRSPQQERRPSSAASMYRSGGSSGKRADNRNRFFSPRNLNDPKLLGREGRSRSRQGRMPLHVLAEMEQVDESEGMRGRQPFTQHNLSYQHSQHQQA